jgi:hypothetical protein
LEIGKIRRLTFTKKEANLNLDFVENQTQGSHFHYDFEQEKEVPYKYVWFNDPIDFYDKKRRN